jgi:hypothetical protein
MVRPGGTRQHFRSKRSQTALDPEPLGLHLAEVELIGTLPSNDDEIDALRYERTARPEALTAEPFDAISGDCYPNLARHDEPETGGARGRRLRRDQQGKVMGRYAPAQPLRARELGMLAQPAIWAEVARHYFL